MARGLFTTGFTVAEVLAIQQRAKELLLEGKTIMNWNDADTSASKQFVMPLDQVLEECAYPKGVVSDDAEPHEVHRSDRGQDKGSVASTL